MLRVVLADDHSILRDGLRRGLVEAGIDVVGEASNGEEAVGLALESKPDVVVMDLSMPVLDGIGATARLKAELPDTRVIVLTMHDDPVRTHAAVRAGAVAYLNKGVTLDEVLDTIHKVVGGETVLSPDLAASVLRTAGHASKRPLLSERQVEILQNIADGLTTKQTARQIGITQKTVHNHLNAVYRRLDAQSLTQAVLSAVRLGIVDLHVGSDDAMP